MKDKVVYAHKRNDTNEIFYIGIGGINRPYDKTRGRSKHWHNINNKVGITVEILFTNLTKEEAISKEIELIKFYGRIDIKTGNLINLTNGGEGGNGKKVTEEVKLKISKSLKGNSNAKGNKGKVLSDETKLKISKSMKGTTRCIGTKRSDACRLQMSIDRKGKPRKPMTDIHKANLKLAWEKRKLKIN